MLSKEAFDQAMEPFIDDESGMKPHPQTSQPERFDMSTPVPAPDLGGIKVQAPMETDDSDLYVSPVDTALSA